MKSYRITVSVLCAFVLVCTPLSAALAQDIQPDVSGGNMTGLVGDTESSKQQADEGSVPAVVQQASGEQLEGSAASSVSDAEIAETLTTADIVGAHEGAAAGVASTLDLLASAGVTTLAGESLYDTAAAEARYAYSASSWAIVASGESSVDALAATSLAGALDCPILLTSKSSLPAATSDALASLGVTNVIITGGEGVISASVADEISAQVGTSPTRLFGQDQYDTQLAIYAYGADRSLWGSQAIVVSGVAGQFADALSAAPVAFAQKAPIFFVDETGSLPDATIRVLFAAAPLSSMVAVGGSAVVAERTIGALQAIVVAHGHSRSNVVRLFGNSLYDTSANVAAWAVENAILSWDNVAFATGKMPYDALAGSVVQGRDRSVLLLVDEGSMQGLDAVVSSGASISGLKFLGGTSVVKAETRRSICSALGLPYLSVSSLYHDISLAQFAQIESSASGKYTVDEILSSMDPARFAEGTSGFYQFADLSQGYSGMTADQLDSFIDANVSYQEKRNGVRSKLRGSGASFIAAAKKYQINEVYLLAHAALESGWGCSALAQGTVKGYEGYLNFYGIGAYDLDPKNGGAALAKDQQWDTPEKAILGAARWISRNYIHPTVASATVSGPQNTLWQMKWDVRRAVAEGGVWHQYATSRTWATGIASVMNDFYRQSNHSFEETGLSFIVPAFAQQ
ncbi:MAG: cell wall-binding repeat-containing protein [Raoultibacter sp.]